MNRRTVNLAVLGSLAAALGGAVLATPAAAAEQEKCYGVSMKGQNDCAAGSHDCKGHSKVDYDPASFKLVPKGTCTTMKTPKGMGMLEPGKM
jgi:uncharacterized membrane protein